MTTPGTHPTESLLVQYAAGTLPEMLRSRIDSHLTSCTECWETVIVLRVLDDLDSEGLLHPPTADEAARMRREVFSCENVQSLAPAEPDKPRREKPSTGRWTVGGVIAGLGIGDLLEHLRPANPLLGSQELPVDPFPSTEHASEPPNAAPDTPQSHSGTESGEHSHAGSQTHDSHPLGNLPDEHHHTDQAEGADSYTAEHPADVDHNSDSSAPPDSHTDNPDLDDHGLNDHHHS